MHYQRKIKKMLTHLLKSGKSVLLLGPRQVGKTTLLTELKFDLTIDLSIVASKRLYEMNPDRVIAEVEALGKKNPKIYVDEIQKVPEILNSIQSLIDKNRAQFVLTGSSARKLKKQADVNLLPGRLISLRMDPISIEENTSTDLLQLLENGSLPKILLEKDAPVRDLLLHSYVDAYLEEEVRAEALVRNIPHFSRFLELAAIDSGREVSMKKISQQIGIAHTTIAAYYEVLVDCLIADRIEPISFSKSRKKLIKNAKHLFFDLGVRRIAAHESKHADRKKQGLLFEHFIGNEILRLIRSNCYRDLRLKFWRDADGPEVDFVIEMNHRFFPIEVKLSGDPIVKECKGLITFLKEYDCPKGGYIVCTSPRSLKLAKNITALPWQDLPRLVRSIA